MNRVVKEYFVHQAETGVNDLNSILNQLGNGYTPRFMRQAATGMVGFAGVHRQKGHGFFSRLLSKAVYPLMKFLGKKAAIVGANIASDVVVNNKDWKESAKSRLVETGKEVANAGLDRAKQFIVEGKGKKRKRSKKLIKSRKLTKLDIEKLING